MPSWDPRRPRPVLDRGAPAVPPDPLLDGRLSVAEGEPRLLLLRKVRVADAGIFRVTDLAGFPVADAHLQVDAGLLVLCLLSCLYKVHRRNQKNHKLTLIAQQAGKGDGQAFRQRTAHRD
ncbi:hypothetical protein CRUP_037482 [Coryphaenoides rupestris]|nr:hypothetical protein CRUP_037482 [Coryphaenoides rupestris]